MPPQEQADLWMALRDRMKTNWTELTLQEKKAGMLYSPHLPPAQSRCDAPVGAYMQCRARLRLQHCCHGSGTAN